ncbi:YfjI family protein [Sphingopyxis alaskensis]|uniref:YfjI family protein n=1 Tax=Sphingopyxis alaskensis TaxID=117207 RepID=UPI0039189691
MNKSIKKRFKDAEKIERPEPLPLRRESGPAQPYPVKALGKVLAGAVNAIVDKVQCPDAIAAQSVLAAAALAAQAHADVVHPATGDRRPISLFLVTVAASGERKSAADRIAFDPIRLREAELHEQYDRDFRVYGDLYEVRQRTREAILRKCKGDPAEAQKQLAALGQVPTAPLTPVLAASDTTIEGLHKLMSGGEPSIGIFSDEGGTFIGGYSMTDESRLRTGAGLSSLWDGTPIKRVRGGDGVSMLKGRRLSMHLMAQPGIAEGLLADPMLQHQGLPSRLLVTAPASLAGTRIQKPLKPSTEAALKRYNGVLLKLLKMKQRRASPANPELNPRPIPLSAAARDLWLVFANECESELAAEQRLEPVRAFANKLAEHALRIAAVLELVDNPSATEISAEAFTRAATLSRYYAGEALRLFEQGVSSIEIQRAEKVLHWLRKKWGKPTVALQHVYQLGPNSVREAKLAREVMRILEDHHWVARIEGGAKIDGKRHRDAWEIARL